MRSLLPAGLTLAAAAALGCGHEPPFGDEKYWSDVPRTPGVPLQLTFSSPGEFAPTWTPDGRSIAYTLTRVDRPDNPDVAPDGDRCLAFLPATGGQVRRQLCYLTPATERTTDVKQEGAVGPEGRLVYSRATNPKHYPIAITSELVLADTLDRRPRLLQTLPASASNGERYNRATYLRWLDPSHLVYVADRAEYTGESLGNDTVRIAVGVNLLRITSDSSVVELLPGTEGATSVAVGDGAELYFTRAGDSRVYRRDPSGAIGALWDFGPGNIARDVVYDHGRLLAIVGGDVSYGDIPGIGLATRDHGGALHAVDLASSVTRSVGLGGLQMRRPALSPDGERVVVEALAGRLGPDLWLLDAPWP